MAHGTVNGKPSTTYEHENYQRQELEQQEQVNDRAQALALKLAQTYEELTRLLERNPGVKRQITEGEAREDKVYQKLKQRLKMADMAPRCQWVRQDGTSCRSPQMKQHIYCFAHRQMAEARALMLMLPAPEDANAIQVGLMRIQKAVIEDTISMKKAGLLLYSMQLALTNVGQTTFGQAKDEEMVRDTVDEMEALTNQHSALSQDETFETQRNGGSGGEEGLPRINADERGLENSRNPIEWKPTVDMYRMDTREGMEAYEASLRRNIAPTFASQRREMQLESAAIPHEHAEVHNSSLRDERLQFSSLTQDSSPGLGPRKPNGSLDADTVVGSVLQTEPYANLG